MSRVCSISIIVLKSVGGGLAEIDALLLESQAVVLQGKLAASPWPNHWYRVVLLRLSWLHYQAGGYKSEG